MSKKASALPTRTCVACGQSDAKQGLVRFVRGKDGAVACDASGRAAGRGAYLCADAACFAAAEKRERLGRALKCQLSGENYQQLRGAFDALCAEREQFKERVVITGEAKQSKTSASQAGLPETHTNPRKGESI